MIIYIFNKVCIFLVDEEAVSKVFWTSVTKSGCAGQYTQCFVGDDKANLEYGHRILSSATGGSCVGVSLSEQQLSEQERTMQLTAKTLPCTTKLFLACQGETIRSAESINIQEHIDQVGIFIVT